MRSRRNSCCVLLAGVFCLLLSSLLSAQSTPPPGVCSDTNSVCTATNTCPQSSTSCTLQVSHSGTSTAVVAYNGNIVNDFCVYATQTVVWQEGENNAEYMIGFLATPFNTNLYSFQGTTSQPSSGTIEQTPAYGCYKFTIRQQVGANIYSADPKVVIHGSGTQGAKKKKTRRRGEETPTTPDQPQQ
jgi:hypothetical protein